MRKRLWSVKRILWSLLATSSLFIVGLVIAIVLSRLSLEDFWTGFGLAVAILFVIYSLLFLRKNR